MSEASFSQFDLSKYVSNLLLRW